MKIGNVIKRIKDNKIDYFDSLYFPFFSFFYFFFFFSSSSSTSSSPPLLLLLLLLLFFVPLLAAVPLTPQKIKVPFARYFCCLLPLNQQLYLLLIFR